MNPMNTKAKEALPKPSKRYENNAFIDTVIVGDDD